MNIITFLAVMNRLVEILDLKNIRLSEQNMNFASGDIVVDILPLVLAE